MKRTILAILAGLLLGAGAASAQGPGYNPYCNPAGMNYQAAANNGIKAAGGNPYQGGQQGQPGVLGPWYLYWPYDGHFQTIAPMAHGLYYPPPLYTGNPYLPGAYPGYVPGNPVPGYPMAPMKP